MSTTTGKIGLQIHEIQTIVRDSATPSVDKEKIDLHISNVIDYIQEVDEEIESLESKISKKNSEIDSLVNDIDEVREQLGDITLPTATLDDTNKNKILKDLHKNLNIHQLEELEAVAKGFLPKGILWKEVLD